MLSIYVASPLPTLSQSQLYCRAVERTMGTPWVCLYTAVLQNLDLLGVGVYITDSGQCLQEHLLRAAATKRLAVTDGAGWV